MVSSSTAYVPLVDSSALTTLQFETAAKAFSIPFLALGGVLYIAGALMYAERCPERISPGKFDLFGSSHQIFHFAILAAAYAHYRAVMGAAAHVAGRHLLR